LRTSAERSASHLLRTMLTSALEESPVVSAGGSRGRRNYAWPGLSRCLPMEHVATIKRQCARGLTLNEDVSAW